MRKYVSIFLIFTIMAATLTWTGGSRVRAAGFGYVGELDCNSGCTVPCDTTGAGVASCALTYTPTAGNAVCMLGSFFTSTGATESDSRGDVPQQVVPYSFNGSAIHASCFFNVVGGSTVFTQTFSGGNATFNRIGVIEEAGVNAWDNTGSQMNLASHSGTGTSVNSVDDFVGSTHDQTEIALGFGVANTNFTWSANSSWTLRSTSAATQFGIEDQQVTASANASMTISLSGNWNEGVVTLYHIDNLITRQEIDHNDGVAAASTTDAMSTHVPVVAGHMLTDVSVWVSSVNTNTPTDTFGSIFTCRPQQAQTGEFGSMCYAVAAGNGIDTITRTWTGAGATFIGRSISELNVGPLDVANETGQGGAGAPTSPTVTTSKIDTLIGWYTTANGHVVTTPGAGYVLRTSIARSVGFETAYNVAAGMVNATFGPSTVTNWSCGILAFTSPAGGLVGGGTATYGPTAQYGPKIKF